MKKDPRAHVYMLASRKGGVLYLGVTNDIVRRLYEHRSECFGGFAKRYNATRLVYLEEFASIEQAIETEKRLKRWKRQWKIDLIEKDNPEWDDLSPGRPAL